MLQLEKNFSLSSRSVETFGSAARGHLMGSIRQRTYPVKSSLILSQSRFPMSGPRRTIPPELRDWPRVETPCWY
jgi:hypothetical protein